MLMLALIELYHSCEVLIVSCAEEELPEEEEAEDEDDFVEE